MAKVITYVLSEMGGGGGRSSFRCSPSVLVSAVTGTGMASFWGSSNLFFFSVGGREASFPLVIWITVRDRVRFGVWVLVGVRVRVRTLTTLSVPHEPSFSHLFRCCCPWHPTAMQEGTSVSHHLGLGLVLGVPVRREGYGWDLAEGKGKALLVSCSLHLLLLVATRA
jgi:hypothetical protein